MQVKQRTKRVGRGEWIISEIMVMEGGGGIRCLHMLRYCVANPNILKLDAVSWKHYILQSFGQTVIDKNVF